jgi:hypothetical protein
VNTVKCQLCRVDVPIDKIDLPNRCLHPQCPLNERRGNVPDPQCAQVSGSSISTRTLSRLPFWMLFGSA